MWEEKRSLIVIACIVFLIYMFFLPGFWPLPRVNINIPSEGSLSEDIKVDVSVKAWHSNFDVVEVRCIPEYVSTAFAPGKILPIIELPTENPRTAWIGWQINRITWPRSRNYQFTIPVKKLAGDGILNPGELKGAVSVRVAFANPRTRRRYGGPVKSSLDVTNSKSFSIQLD